MTISSRHRTPLSSREIYSLMAGLHLACGSHLQAECAITNLLGEVVDHPPHGGN